MPPIRQSSFAGGELSPTLWSRTDLEKYGTGLRRLKDFIVTPHGSAANRPGTRYGGSTKGDAAAWMLPFAFSDTDTMVVVFTDHAIQFVTRDANGLPGFVESAPGVRLEVATPYAAADLPKLRAAQVGNVIRLACKGYATMLLTRTGTAPLAFSFAAISYAAHASWLPLAEPYISSVDAAVAPDASHPVKKWEWSVTTLLKDAGGGIIETLPKKITKQALLGSSGVGATDVPAGGVVCYTDRPIAMECYAAVPPALPAGYTIAGYRIYKGLNGLAGYIGEGRMPFPLSPDWKYGFLFQDDGIAPNFERQPPAGRDPFGSDYPSAVAFYEQRFVAGGTPAKPGFIWFSGSDAYEDADQPVPAVASNSLEFELAAVKREEVRALVPGRVLLAFTSSGEWAIAGGERGDPISALAFGARPRTARGSSWVEPVKVGDDEVLFFPPAGNVVRELALDGNTGKYSAPDATIFSKHLFAGRQIVARAWQEEPWSVVWLALDDGSLLSFSYVAEHQLRAWAWHDLAGGAVEALCCVREGAEDALYLVVRRTINGATKRFVERMDTRIVTDAKRGLFLDAAVSYDGAPAAHFTGLAHLEGCTVNALADGNVVQGLLVQGGAVDLPADLFPDGASIVHVGLAYAPEFEPLDVAPGKGKERVKTVTHAIVEFDGSRGFEVAQGWDKKFEEWRERQLSHGYEAIPLESGEVKVAISSSWNAGGRIVLRHVDPLPLTITAIVRVVEYGG